MTDQTSKHDHVLISLTMNLQAMAMVQLGKVTSPVSGELERDLEGARSSIDILEMLKTKCRTDTPEPLLQILDQAVMDLQMNYMDELKKDAEGDEDTTEDTTEDTAEDATDDASESEAADA